MCKELRGDKASNLLLTVSMVFIIIGVVAMFGENIGIQVPLWVSTGSFTASTWLSVIRFRIIGGRK
ncbi:MAG: hypothetical protein K6A71_08255 [Lachnospiraceae bacterium]|nr:hypothetical protein [Lachnospiraceae bacterium]